MADAKPSRPTREPRAPSAPVEPTEAGPQTLPEPGEGAAVAVKEFVDKDGSKHIIETYR